MPSINLANAGASEFNGPGSLCFECVDVASADDLHAYLTRHAAATDGVRPPVVYLRRVLHAIDGAAERTLLRTLVNALDDGFVLAAEFRTVKDRSADGTYGSHYRWLIDHHHFAKQLRDEYGFHIEAFEAVRGLSPTDGEDPHLARVLGRLPSAA